MNKLMTSINMARKIMLFLTAINLGALLLPLPSMADREYLYKSCAELQQVMNEYNNPRKKYERFEKVRMMRRDLGDEVYIIFCNGGLVTNRELGTICRGYIAYSFSRIGGGANYYSRWGRTEGLYNDGDTGIEDYCRWIE